MLTTAYIFNEINNKLLILHRFKRLEHDRIFEYSVEWQIEYSNSVFDIQLYLNDKTKCDSI